MQPADLNASLPSQSLTASFFLAFLLPQHLPEAPGQPHPQGRRRLEDRALQQQASNLPMAGSSIAHAHPSAMRHQQCTSHLVHKRHAC
jgi:hypothetical protein